jgi:hypothetical protein
MRFKSKVIYLYLVLIFIYAAGTLLLPPAKDTLQKYHLTLLHLRLVSLTIIILYGAIWLCAFYGFYKLSNYAHLIRKNKDGKPISKLTIGIGLLALWLPAVAIFSLYSNYFAQNHAGWLPAVTIAQNYLSLIMPLAGFIFISIGSCELSGLVKKLPTVRATNIIVLLVVIAGVIYTYLITSTHNRLNSTYHMPLGLVIATFVVPYIFMWYLGIKSFYEIYLYKTKVAGIIYRKAWTLLSLGLGWLIAVSISLQYLTTISQRLSRLSLNSILIIVYILLLAMAIGYVLIALGAKNLKRIEEV